MKRITSKQREIIVGLFSRGTSMQCLAEVYDVRLETIEAIIRKALENIGGNQA